MDEGYGGSYSGSFGFDELVDHRITSLREISPVLEGFSNRCHNDLPLENTCGIADDSNFEPSAFDISLLSDHSDARHYQASHGRTRLSLPPGNRTNLTGDLDEPSWGPQTAYPLHSPVDHELPPSPSLRRQYHARSRHTELTDEDPAADVLPARRGQGPVVLGIPLIATGQLPDRLRAIFPFEYFNAIQSKSFPAVYQCDDNFVLSSPTGSGKTAIFELAVARVIMHGTSANFKIVYMAPTKALCSERKKDWAKKFSQSGLNVQEFTGDTDTSSLRAVQSADIIITTPEKWDSMTRKWRDHEKLIKLIRLLLIDEVHILNKDRGATLEAVVSRMKSLGSSIRIIALSATIPNAADIATWLGKDQTRQHLPANREDFGSEFRPVPLRIKVMAYNGSGNDHQYDALLTKKLSDILSHAPRNKPIMVFCFTRKSCTTTAAALAAIHHEQQPGNKPWKVPTRPIRFEEEKLNETVRSGVAYHHAGLSKDDKATIESLYLKGELGVICCTSTLAVGVNLPCHTVILKGTSAWEESGPVELSDLEVLQMLGRAGRPQFDTQALAIIVTKPHRKEYFSTMIRCEQVLESRLHLNLIEHINSEVGLGTIRDLPSAIQWLSGTFFCVRFRANPGHYHIDTEDGDELTGDKISQICARALELLSNHDLIRGDGVQRQTAFGSAMSRYCISFETMKGLVVPTPKSKVSELLSLMCSSHEFRDMKFRHKEKQAFKDTNSNPSIRFPFKIDIATCAQKASLIIQAALGGVETLGVHESYKHQYRQDLYQTFQHARRIIRAIVDCQVARNDSMGLRNGLMLVRSLGARVWDDSPLAIQQLAGVGPVGARKLINAGIKSINDIANASPPVIERAVGHNPPAGLNMIKRAKDFPRLRLSLRIMGAPVTRKGEHVSLMVQAEIAFVDQNTAQKSKQYESVCFLAETSDNRCMDFCKISYSQIQPVLHKTFTAILTHKDQLINCYVSCEELAGTQERAWIKPDVPASAFEGIVVRKSLEDSGNAAGFSSNTTLRTRQKTRASSDEFFDAALDDAELVNFDFGHERSHASERSGKPDTRHSSSNAKDSAESSSADHHPERLPNGNRKCRHNCKAGCKHECCREGLQSRPKPRTSKKKASDDTKEDVRVEKGGDRIQRQLQFEVSTARSATAIPKRSLEQVDLSLTPDTPTPAAAKKQLVTLQRLHDKTTPKDTLKMQGISTTLPDVKRSMPARTETQYLDEFESFVDIDSPWQFEGGAQSVSSRAAETASRPRSFFQAEAVTTSLPQEDECLGQGKEDESDEDMLDAILVGAEDSYKLSSPNDSLRTESADRPEVAGSGEDYIGHNMDFGHLEPGGSAGYFGGSERNKTIPRHSEMPGRVTDTETTKTNAVEKTAERKELEAFVLEYFGTSVELV